MSKKISELPIADNLDGAVVPIVQDGATKQISADMFGGGGEVWGIVDFEVMSETLSNRQITVRLHPDDPKPLSYYLGKEIKVTIKGYNNKIIGMTSVMFEKAVIFKPLANYAVVPTSSTQTASDDFIGLIMFAHSGQYGTIEYIYGAQLLYEGEPFIPDDSIVKIEVKNEQ